MMTIQEILAHLGSIFAAAMFAKAFLVQYFPHHLKSSIEKHSLQLVAFLSPYIQITFHEFTGEHLMRGEAYSAIETYLGSTSAAQAWRLTAEVVRTSTQTLSLSMDDNEEVTDEFKGVRVWWASGKKISKNQTVSNRQVNDERRFYQLKFHKKHRDFVIGSYLNYVMEEGRRIMAETRRRKLFTNSGQSWSHVAFEHPATFENLAMDAGRKKEVVEDLTAFSRAGDFYARIGRPWKRGYLLYGPPGTGKSTMIAAMANLLSYDVYDLELTAVKDNTELKKLLIATCSKSIIVIEDIDCSSDLTRQRAQKRAKNEDGSNDDRLQEAKTGNKITLSGLLNFIDGIWSACGGERVIVFTTNHVERLDPALIRRGRMDKRIEMSYCDFEGFKVLCKNYVGLEWHCLFPRIEELLGEVEITPADVAECLMPKSVVRDGAEVCLKDLVLILEETQKRGGVCEL